MNIIQEYLKDTIKNCSLYTVTSQDNLDLKNIGLPQVLNNKLTSKKFRKWGLQPECEKRVKKAIEVATNYNIPLQIILPAGGYKLWKFPSFPEVDWAEFFNIDHVIRYLAPICSLYPKGVEFNYYLFTLLMQKSNGLTSEEVAKYLNSFQTLIDSFLKYTPSNLKIKIVKDVDFYSESEYFSLLKQSLNEAPAVFDNFPPEKKEKYLKSSKLNIKGEINDEKIKIGSLYEVAGGVNYFPKINDWIFDKNKIIIFPQSKKEFIGIGSTHCSITKYWTGYGVLEKNKERFNNRILSPKQFEHANKMTYETVPITFLNLKNFSNIRVYNTFNFLT